MYKTNLATSGLSSRIDSSRRVYCTAFVRISLSIDGLSVIFLKTRVNVFAVAVFADLKNVTKSS